MTPAVYSSSSSSSSCVCGVDSQTDRRTDGHEMRLWWSQSARRSLALSGANVVIRRRSAARWLGLARSRCQHEPRSRPLSLSVGRASPIDNLAAPAAGIFAVQMTRLSGDADEGEDERAVARLVVACRQLVVVGPSSLSSSSSSSCRDLSAARCTLICSTARRWHHTDVVMASNWRHHPASALTSALLSTLVGVLP